MEGRKSRVYRALVTTEVLVMVDPERTATVHEDMITLDTDNGDTARVEFDAMLRDAIQEHDAGSDIWVVPGEITIGPIEELTT